MFAPATRSKIRLRLAIAAPSGAGKTYTALRLAHLLGEKVAVVDTEQRSTARYVGESPDGSPWAFDVCPMDHYDPQRLIDAIAAAAAQYDVLVIDSLSHYWNGPGGFLAKVDEAARRKKGNTFMAWADVKPLELAFWSAITSAPCHVIATMRSKTAYVMEQGKGGKTVPRKVGMAPQMREGVEYEFDLFAEMDQDHHLIVSKSRCSALADAVIKKPGPELAQTLKDWMATGAEVDPASTPSARLVASMEARCSAIGIDAQKALEVMGHNGDDARAAKLLGWLESTEDAALAAALAKKGVARA